MTEKTNEKLYKERWDRMEKALKHEKVDKLPVVIMGAIPCAKLADSSIVTSDILFRSEYFIDKAFEGLEILKDVDSTNVFLFGYSKASGLPLMSNAKLPGVDIGKDDILQIDEKPHMTFEEYDTILSKGWLYFSDLYIKERLHITAEDMQADFPFYQMAQAKHDEAGYVEFSGAPHPAGWDVLTAMRGMNNFFRDLKKDPQMIKDVLAVMCDECYDDYLESLKHVNSFAAMLQPAVRANCDFVSRKMYEEFVWPYVMKFGDAIINAGVNIHFHYDAKWDSFLDLYTYFPKNRCIFDSDGMTDIYKVKEILGDRMAITGNVSPSMLAIGNPDDVFNFVIKQIKDIGPEGYIVCSSCTLPSNCKPENLKAMVAACRY